jgi:hypothetical protein
MVVISYVAPILGHPTLGVNCTAPLKRDERKKNEEEGRGNEAGRKKERQTSFRTLAEGVGI